MCPSFVTDLLLVTSFLCVRHMRPHPAEKKQLHPARKRMLCAPAVLHSIMQTPTTAEKHMRVCCAQAGKNCTRAPDSEKEREREGGQSKCLSSSITLDMVAVVADTHDSVWVRSSNRDRLQPSNLLVQQQQELLLSHRHTLPVPCV